MPITAKLSSKFYETLGDEVANELVDWLNAVDTSYRAEFRDLFGANFGRLEAEMRVLRAETDARLDAVRGEIRQLRSEVDTGVNAVHAEMRQLRAEVDTGISAVRAETAAGLDALRGDVKGDIHALRLEMDARFKDVDRRFQVQDERIDKKLEGLKSELLRWMFLFWVGSLGTVLAILKF